jgi:2-methylisocitrate lyase-like PEP mutase family enzyme
VTDSLSRPASPAARLRQLLAEIGYTIAAYPLTLLSAAVRAMQESLRELHAGRLPGNLISFEELQKVVGFSAYDREAARYAQAPEKEETDGQG